MSDASQSKPEEEHVPMLSHQDDDSVSLESGGGRLFSCDACSNVCFGNEAQLEEHVRTRHLSAMFPQYDALESAATHAHDGWAALGQMPAVTSKLSQWGEKAFALAQQRDGGPAKMQEAHAARAQLQVAVQRWLPSCSVYIFGSSVALGVWDGSSDVDFTVVDVAALEKGAWNPHEKQAVRSIAQVLYRAGFSSQNLELIPFARVPIIKHHKNTPLIPQSVLKAAGKFSDDVERSVARSARFSLASPASPQDRILMEASIRASIADPNGIQHMWWDRRGQELCVTFVSSTESMRALTAIPATTATNKCTRGSPLHLEFSPELFHIDFDLSFRVFGIRNSQLLRKYLMAHPCARPGSLVLKDWSKSSGVNNSQAGFLTSYAINILWIYFLVQRAAVPYVDPLDIPMSLASPEHSCDPEYAPMLDPTLTAEQRQAQFTEMGRLLVDFFKYYACEFNWSEHVVSLNRDGVTTKHQLGWDEEDVQQGRKHTRYVMCIEDPYEENLNLGRHLGPTKSMKVQQEFRRAFLSLLKDGEGESCVFEMSDCAMNTETLLPPADALIKLMTHCLVAFEESSYQQNLEAKDAPLAKGNGPVKSTFVKSDVLHHYLQQRAPTELELALKCWSWHQLLYRLGYKCLGGVVYRRGSLAQSQQAGRSAPLAQSEASAPPSDASSRVRASIGRFLDTLESESEGWAKEVPAEEAKAADSQETPPLNSAMKQVAAAPLHGMKPPQVAALQVAGNYPPLPSPLHNRWTCHRAPPMWRPPTGKELAVAASKSARSAIHRFFV